MRTTYYEHKMTVYIMQFKSIDAPTVGSIDTMTVAALYTTAMNAIILKTSMQTCNSTVSIGT